MNHAQKARDLDPHNAAVIRIPINEYLHPAVAERTDAAGYPLSHYAGMAGQERAMVVIWQGTAIEKGMRRRRLAEASLMEKP